MEQLQAAEKLVEVLETIVFDGHGGNVGHFELAHAGRLDLKRLDDASRTGDRENFVVLAGSLADRHFFAAHGYDGQQTVGKRNDVFGHVRQCSRLE